MKKLFISSELFIESGSCRDCYKHPIEHNKCIKIPKSSFKKSSLKRELSYMRAIKKRIKTKKHYYSDFVEYVDTNKGIGYVFDLVTNINSQKISKTLHDVYLDALLNQKTDLISSLDLEIVKLQNNIMKDKILVKDLHTKNILVRMNKDSVDGLVIIDGLGRTNSIYPLDRFGLIRKRKLRKEFERVIIPSIKSYKEAFDYMQKYTI